MARKRKADEPAEVNLPIPSFLDMAFQLLFFFVILFKPQNLEVMLDLALPAQGEKRAQEQAQADPTKPSDTELDLTSDVTVTLRTQHGEEGAGNMTSLSVEGMDAEPKSLPDINALKTYLVSLQKNVQNKDNIKIRADGELRYAFVVEVMDACRKAGFQNIGFSPPPDLTGGK
jgi:biopolymer transport protein ExbD